MRFILVSIIGLLASFYLSALIKRLLRRKVHSIVGFIILFFALVLGFFGKFNPLNLLIAFFLGGAGVGIIVYHLLSETYIISERIERNFISKHESKFERMLEILPGALTWIALTSPIWLSFALPFAVAYLIILADTYWLINSFKIAALVFIGYKKMESAKKQNWLKKLQDDFPGALEKYYHLIVLPTYKEGLDVLSSSFDALVNSNYPKEKIFLSVGFEERDDAQKIKETKDYLKKFEEEIAGVFTTIHPFGLPNEVPGPGSNRNWMIKNALEELRKKGVKPEDVLVTTLDADFCIHQEFLPGMLYKYLSTPEDKRDKRSYTGVFMYYNNYWQTPAPMRLIATGTALWQLSEMVGSDKYINYASLSINLKPLLDLGLWIPDKVNDDSGFYWKAYYFFKGDYKVIPHFLPINADAVLDINLPKTFQNQYLQLKRWAYGVEHIPFIVKKYFQDKQMDFWDKTDKLIFIFWSYLKWGALALFISFGGLLIPLINTDFSQSVVSHNLSVISSWILTAAFVGLFATIYVHEKTAPKRPANWSIITRVFSYIQWSLVPIIIVTIATLPAIDAQTSLMLGRYLEFRTTVKVRIPQSKIT